MYRYRFKYYKPDNMWSIHVWNDEDIDWQALSGWHVEDIFSAHDIIEVCSTYFDVSLYKRVKAEYSPKMGLFTIMFKQ